MSLSVGQATYGGQTIGPGGGPYTWRDIKGLTGLPSIRSGDLPRPNDEGMLAGYDYSGDRIVEFTMEVVGNANTMQQNLTTIRQAFQHSKTLAGGIKASTQGVTQLVFNLGEANGAVGVNRFINARVRHFEDVVNLGWAGGSWLKGIAQIAVQMVAVDPRIYDASLQSATVGLTIGAGGWTFPWTFPWTFTASTSALITAVNSGTFNCPGYFSIVGPCINPRIQNQTSGVTCKFLTTLGASDTLVIDAYAGTAVLNGTASRLSALAGGSNPQALTVAPGSNTYAFFSDDVSATAAAMTMYWTNTWI